MKIQSLELINYRNYEHINILFFDGIHIILGQNAQGKTNLLESLVYLSLTRSYRIHDDSKLIQVGKDVAKIKVKYLDEYEKVIEAIIHPQGKTLLYNHQLMKKSSEFIGLLNVVLFSPDDLKLFNDAPRERRRLINQEITKVSSKYLNALNRYQNLLKNRNQILKEKNVDFNYLDTVTEQMIDESVLIIEERKNFIDQINKRMKDKYQYLSNTNQSLKIQYQCCIDNQGSIKEVLKEVFQNSLQRDLETKMTNVGIHREDISFELDGVEFIQIASQGQKRMAMLAFKLALLDYIENKTHKQAILLLDDVLSELDAEKQVRLLEMIQPLEQCFITTTEVPETFNQINKRAYIVQNGTITLVKE